MKTAAFYSYKGGVGRSLFVANLSLFLARFAAKKVLTIDLDLEAPGLHYKYKETGVDVPPFAAGLVDTLHDYLYADVPPEALPILDLWRGPEGGSVHFFPAGAAPRTAYWETLATMDFHALMRDDQETGRLLFIEVLEHIREQLAPDVVLVDARTGVTDLGAVAAQVWAQQVFCMALDQEEHLEGTRAVMRGIARRRTDGEGLIKVVPVLSRMQTVYGSDEEKDARERVRNYLNEKGPSTAETLSIESGGGDILVLHHDEEVCRTGRVLMGEGALWPSRLLSDYFEAGLRFVEPEERAEVRARTLAVGKANQEPLNVR